MIFDFIHQHRTRFPVRLMCQTLGVSVSGYYAARARPQPPRTLRRDALASQIRNVHAQSQQIYGSPRVHQTLLKSGTQVCRNTVARLMKSLGIKARSHRRFRMTTTDSTHPHRLAPDHLQRRFDVAQLNRVWASDITYVPTGEGFLYLAGVMDLASRRIVGWSMSATMHAELACQAFIMAVQARRPAPGLIHHSDRGVQYACDQYQRLLRLHGAVPSMSRRGNCYDNAVSESFWGRLKTELTHHRRFATREEAKQAIFTYIEVFYNRQRLHSTLGYQSPEQFEAGRR